MKSYLELIPISARVHRRQSRMTRLCILFAVFLVAAVFSMADMEIRSQKIMAIRDDGAFHVLFEVKDRAQAALIGARPEIQCSSLYNVTNYRLDEDYDIQGLRTGLCGVEEDFFTLYPGCSLLEGTFPTQAGEALVSQGIQARLGLQVGDSFTLNMPGGAQADFIISGFVSETSLLTSFDGHILLLRPEDYSALLGPKGESGWELLTQFKPFVHINRAIEEIRSCFDLQEGQIRKNTKLLGLMLQSDDSYMLSLYLTALVLAALVITAGGLMITGSLNSSVAKRTEFFGLLRCLGAEPRQVKRFVRLEALNWCKSAIPAGLGLSVAVVWLLCALLRHMSPEYFSGMPVMAVSWGGLLMGAVLGLITVLLASGSPAKLASKVSPLAAMSGNGGSRYEAKHAASSAFRVETALGVHHAMGSRKNFLLLCGSFAFSIILFLSFHTGIDFMEHAVKPLRPDAPDIRIHAAQGSAVSQEQIKALKACPGVKLLFGQTDSDSAPEDIDSQEAWPIVGIQLCPQATEEDVQQLREIAGEDCLFSDKRLSNREVLGAYYAMALFVYGFLAIIAVIAVFNIVNSVSMSFSAHIQQYGAMRAIGMSDKQLKAMVRAEAVSYALGGVFLGAGLGLPIHHFLFRKMISERWGDIWSLPWLPLAVIVLIMAASVWLSLLGPAQQVREMSIVETISAQ